MSCFSFSFSLLLSCMILFVLNLQFSFCFNFLVHHLGKYSPGYKLPTRDILRQHPESLSRVVEFLRLHCANQAKSHAFQLPIRIPCFPSTRKDAFRSGIVRFITCFFIFVFIHLLTYLFICFYKGTDYCDLQIKNKNTREKIAGAIVQNVSFVWNVW